MILGLFLLNKKEIPGDTNEADKRGECGCIKTHPHKRGGENDSPKKRGNVDAKNGTHI